jgi:hypothetical protein
MGRKDTLLAADSAFHGYMYVEFAVNLVYIHT